MFILPKKVIKAIETISRTFLWTGGASASRKALISWEQICMPKSAGRLNILHIQTWNKAAVCKMLWNLCNKEDRLWVKWVRSYYIKGGNVWMCLHKQASWTLQKIFKATKFMTAAGLDETSMLLPFSVRKMYLLLRGQFPKVQWRRVICNNYGAPKWIFILYLALNRKLYTKDKTPKMGAGRYQPVCSL